MTAVDDRPEVGLSQTADGRPVPSVSQRAYARLVRLDLESRLTSWLSAIAVTLLAFGLRVWHLGSPNRLAFDETYYAKDAWSMLHNGYDRNYLATVDGLKIDDAIKAGHTTGIWGDGPTMVVHPEVGKWMIALGEKAFGMTPFGWRISACVTGALMVLVMIRLTRRVTGSTLLGLVAGLLMTFDGLEFVLSRLALLDIFLGFWLLCGVACVVADRDWFRMRLVRLYESDDSETGSWGPTTGTRFRPWLLAAGMCFGLACGVKWSAIYPLAAFGLMTWLWSAGARRAHGVRWATARSALVDGVPAFVQLVLVAALVYVASWAGWLSHSATYEDHLSATQYTQFVSEGPCKGEGDDRYPDNQTDPDKRWPTATERDASGLGEVVQSLRSLYYYHHDVYMFHTHYLNCATHTYQSTPLGWPLINRPVSVATDLDVKPGESGCPASASDVCYRQVLLIGTPILWWGGCLALIACAVLWIGTRDWRYGVPVVGMLATWLPWLQYDDRPIFYFYAIFCLPFMVLAIALVMGKLIGPSSAPSRRRTIGVVVSGSFFVLVLLNFAYFYPILSYQAIPKGSWYDRMWFSRWI